jgi:hypothetical protein
MIITQLEQHKMKKEKTSKTNLRDFRMQPNETSQ